MEAIKTRDGCGKTTEPAHPTHPALADVRSTLNINGDSFARRVFVQIFAENVAGPSICATVN